jgi:hypothetical protein
VHHKHPAALSSCCHGQHKLSVLTLPPAAAHTTDTTDGAASLSDNTHSAANTAFNREDAYARGKVAASAAPADKVPPVEGKLQTVPKNSTSTHEEAVARNGDVQVQAGGSINNTAGKHKDSHAAHHSSSSTSSSSQATAEPLKPSSSAASGSSLGAKDLPTGSAVAETDLATQRDRKASAALVRRQGLRRALMLWVHSYTQRYTGGHTLSCANVEPTRSVQAKLWRACHSQVAVSMHVLK